MRDDPHGARYVYEVVKGKAILKVAPGLAKVPQGQGLFMILLVAMASLGSAGGAYYLDTCCSWSPNHPLQLFGVCQPPAVLGPVGGFYGVGSSISCYTIKPQNATINGQVQVVYVQVPAGYYEYLNGSKK